MDNATGIAILGVACVRVVGVAAPQWRRDAKRRTTTAAHLLWQRRSGGAAHRLRDDAESRHLPRRRGEPRRGPVPARQPLRGRLFSADRHAGSTSHAHTSAVLHHRRVALRDSGGCWTSGPGHHSRFECGIVDGRERGSLSYLLRHLSRRARSESAGASPRRDEADERRTGARIARARRDARTGGGAEPRAAPRAGRICVRKISGRRFRRSDVEVGILQRRLPLSHRPRWPDPFGMAGDTASPTRDFSRRPRLD